MDTSIYLKKYIASLASILMEVDEDSFLKLIKTLSKIKYNKSKIYISGNGGSASIASHVSVDFSKSLGLNSLTFNESSLITCFANDYGYENWLSNCITKVCSKKDTLILISSSGTSKNILNAAKTANKIGMNLITFSGFSEKNPLRKKGKLNFWVDSNSYNFVEASHLIILLSAIDFLKQEK